MLYYGFIDTSGVLKDKIAHMLSNSCVLLKCITNNGLRLEKCRIKRSCCTISLMS